MAFTPTVLGTASGQNVTSLVITTSGNFPAGNQILVAVVTSAGAFDDLTDTAGNLYDQKAGSESGVGAYWCQTFNNARLPNNSRITLTYSIPFSGRIAAIGISGLTSGALDRSSAGQGTDANPLVGVDNVGINDWALAMVAVADGSANTFTQDPAWTNPGSFNTQTTTGFSGYAAYKQSVAGGHMVYAPRLVVPATWAALLVTLKS